MSVKLDEFIKDSYKAGKNHKEIESILLESGWDEEVVKESLQRFVDKPYPVAIPKPIVFASPRLTFLNLFYFMLLYIAIYNTTAMVFTVLDYYLPDGLGRMRGMYYSKSPLGESLRLHLSFIICSVPIIFLTNSIINKAIKKLKQHIPKIRLSLIFLTFFIGGCTILGNAISFIYFFLSGELGIRFIIKILILTVLSAGLFFFFRTETNTTESNV